MSGQVKISNSRIISLPGVGKINSYELKADTPCFFIKNHYLYPLEKSYSMKLTNPVSVNQGNELSLKLKIPKQIFSENYIYELKDFDKKVKNLSGGIQIKSSDGCINSKLENGIEVQDHCGWIVIKLTYTTPEICNICEINYSICFNHFKLKTIRGVKTRATEIIPLESVSLIFDIFNRDPILEILKEIDNGNLIVTVKLDIDYNEFINKVDVDQLKEDLIKEYSEKLNIPENLIDIVFTSGSVNIQIIIKVNVNIINILREILKDLNNFNINFTNNFNNVIYDTNKKYETILVIYIYII